MKSKHILYWILSLTFLSLIYLYIPNSVNLSNVDQRLIEHIKGAHRVEADIYMDGGSYGILLYDKEDKLYKSIWIPHSLSYTKYFLKGDINDISEQGLDLNPDTKNYLVNLISAESREANSCIIQFSLTKNPRYLLNCFIRKLFAEFK